MRIGRQVPDPQHYLLRFHVLKISVAEPEPPRAPVAHFLPGAGAHPTWPNSALRPRTSEAAQESDGPTSRLKIRLLP